MIGWGKAERAAALRRSPGKSPNEIANRQSPIPNQSPIDDQRISNVQVF
jgi:hypothetical protein